MPNEIIKVTHEEFERLKPLHNHCLIEIPPSKIIEENKFGLLIIKDPSLIHKYSMDELYANPDKKSTVEAFNEAAMLPRWGIMARNPEELIYNTGKVHWGMDWQTTIETEPGDLVWFDYFSALHAPIIVDGEKRYWMINYQSLIVAKRGDDTIMLNGYILFEQINTGLTSKWLELPKHINKQKGIIRFAGSKNTDYVNKSKCDDIDVEVGDTIVFRNQVECLLEEEGYRKFSEENLRYQQRSDIYAVIN